MNAKTIVIRSAAAMLLLTLVTSCAESEDDDDMEAMPTAAATGEWQVLFDGSSFDAWRGFQQEGMAPGWEIVDDAMVQTDPNSDGDLVTREQFADFELEFEWMVPERGNSGVMYRATEDHGTPWATGPEYQLMDDPGWGEEQTPKNRSASNYDVHAPSQSVAKGAGEWNTGKIVVDGAHVEHWLNGVKVVEYELWSEAWKTDVAASKWTAYPDYGVPESGHIAVQGDHSGVSLRNVRIREL